MKAQSLRWLVVAAVVALGAALYATSVRQPVADAGIGLKLYPDLAAQLNDVTAVRIYGAGDKQVVGIEKAAAGWTVAERAGYPADVGRVRELLLALAKAKTIEKKTAIATKLPALGLEDLTAPAATGKRLELTGTPQPVSLIIGKSPDDHSSFVRRAGEAQSWQVDVALHAESDPRHWVQSKVLEVPQTRVQAVETQLTGGPAWSVAKGAATDAEFAVSGLPKGRELSGPTAASELASSLAALDVDDVRAASTPAPPAAAVTTLRTFDGLVVRIEGFTEGDRHFVRVTPSATTAATAAVPAEVTAIEHLTRGYDLEIPAYKYSTLFPSLAEPPKK